MTLHQKEIPAGYRVLCLNSLTILLPVPVAEAVVDAAREPAPADATAAPPGSVEQDCTVEDATTLLNADPPAAEEPAFLKQDADAEGGVQDSVATLEAPMGPLVKSGLTDYEHCMDGEQSPADVPLLRHVFRADETSALTHRMRTITDVEDKKVLERYRSHMRLGGGQRIVAIPKISSLDELENEHPNFAAPIAHVRNRLLLSKRNGSPPRIPPMLLLGPPGVGKTHFTKALADAMRAPIYRVNFDSPVAASNLIGLDKQWRNSRAGQLFQALVMGTHANPVFLLDELDKSRVSREDDPLAPLHTLLEPGTADSVTDISTEVTFDTSLVTWVATANYSLRIPDTLRSRLTEFWIEMPGPADAIRITTAVAAGVVHSLAPDGFKPLSRRIAVLLAHLTPREVVKAVGDALALAVANGRAQIVRSDFPAEALAEDVSGDGKGLLH